MYIITRSLLIYTTDHPFSFKSPSKTLLHQKKKKQKPKKKNQKKKASVLILSHRKIHYHYFLTPKITL